MRVVFFGTPEFAVPSLSALLEAGIEIVAVVTQPDRPRGRSHSTLVPPPVKQRALGAGIPVWQPERPRGDMFTRQIRLARADVGIVVAYGHILPRELLDIPRLGLVNVHASILPRWRGAAPIQWALLAGDAETGVAVMRVEAGLDTGAVWLTRTTPIDAADTAATLTRRLALLGAAALIDALPRITAGDPPAPQPDLGVTLAPKVDRALARIRWNEPAAQVSRRIRAMDPHPGAWTTFDTGDLKLFGPTPVTTRPGGATAPGAIVGAAGQLLVGTADGPLAIAEVQPAGRRKMPAAEWLRGAAITPASRFA